MLFCSRRQRDKEAVKGCRELEAGDTKAPGGGPGGGPAARPYQEHAEGFPHDAVEEVEGGVPRHHEEVGQEEELPAAVVQQRVVLAAEQRLVGILQRDTRAQRSTYHTPPEVRGHQQEAGSLTFTTCFSLVSSSVCSSY